MTETRIPLYKKRNLSETISDSMQFMRENWKTFFRCVLIIGAPIAIIYGFFMNRYMGDAMNMSLNENADFTSLNVGINYILTMLFSMLLYLAAFSTAISLLKYYEKKDLNTMVFQIDLMPKILDSSWRLFLLNFVVWLMVVLILALAAGIVFAISAASASMAIVVGVIFYLLLFAGMIALAPSIMLMNYPLIIEDLSIWDSIVKGFKLGFKNWGTTIVLILLGGLILGVISLIFSGAHILWVTLATSVFELGIIGTIISYLLSIISSLSMVITFPILAILLAFQYFSIIDKTEGKSIQAEIDHFDSL
ncbi:hypothetical protein LJC06_02645 [Bacteroidales bacterium OttesenSCG-928-I14]|nr:hypothetical protein [Bacteroidales bacterium OttesenSCG-928-I14]